MSPTPAVQIPSAGRPGHQANQSTGQVRLSSRRGSMAAPDPWAQNASQQASSGESTGSGVASSNTPSSASRITIVRVNPSAVEISDEQFGLSGPSPNATTSSRAGRPGRSSSWGSLHSAASSTASTSNHIPRSNSPSHNARQGGPGRMSFAFSSFTPINPPQDTPPSPGAVTPNGSYSSSGRNSPGSVPSSPSMTYKRRYSNPNPNLAAPKQNLTPQQIYDLALSSTSPAPSLPGSPAVSYNSNPLTSHSRPGTPGTGYRDETFAPAVFTPLPDEIYLPFIDRPAEVAQLLTETSTSKLFHLLEALFPKGNLKRSEKVPVREGDKDDPSSWSFHRLSDHLMYTTRAEVGDRLWVEQARICIRGRSEALWERFKGALGVPADLEIEAEEEFEAEEHIEGEEILTEGQVENFAARVGLNVPSAPGSEHPVSRLRFSSASSSSLASDGPEADEFAAIEADLEEDDNTHAHLEPIFAGQFPPEYDVGENSDSAVALGLTPGNVSEDGGWSGRTMENIGEGESEEEEENSANKPETSPDTSTAKTTPAATPSTEHPSQPESADGFTHSPSEPEILALQITTSPLSSSSIALQTSHSFPATSSLGLHHSRSGELNAASPGGAPGNVEHSVSKASLRRPSTSLASQATRPVSDGYRGFGGFGLTPIDKGYHSTFERGPGNPLFPSSFAGLSLGPTLAANNPKHRSLSTSHASHYPSSLAPSAKDIPSSSSNPALRRIQMGGGKRLGSWADGIDRDHVKYEYALTIGSASSDGGRL